MCDKNTACRIWCKQESCPERVMFYSGKKPEGEASHATRSAHAVPQQDAWNDVNTCNYHRRRPAAGLPLGHETKKHPPK